MNNQITIEFSNEAQSPSFLVGAVMRSAFFSVHSVKALENRVFSIVHANIENTPEKVELARSLYPIEDWHFEFHNYKIVFNRCKI